MDSVESHQHASVRRVPWISAWGVFGISWFSFLALLIPAALGLLFLSELHTVKYPDGQPPAQRMAYIAGGTIFMVIASGFFALIAGLLTYLVTMRRWYTPPTALFAIVAIGFGLLAAVGLGASSEKQRNANDARANLDRLNEANREAARQQIESSGFAMPDPADTQQAIDGLRDVADATTDPNERAIYLIGANLGDRLNALMAEYNAVVEPFMETSATDVPNNITEEGLLDRIEILELSKEKNAAVIAYVDRIPAILKNEFANRTTYDAPTRAANVESFLREMNYEDVVLMRSSEQQFLDACREQLMVLLDTHGLWENTPEGYVFYEEVDDAYVERFNAAYEVMQEVIEAQTAAQARIYGVSQPNDVQTEPAGTPPGQP